jgi:hypothetical protein
MLGRVPSVVLAEVTASTVLCAVLLRCALQVSDECVMLTQLYANQASG